MAYFKGGYPPLIGGVSQQVVHARLPNQVTAQMNMLSDIVTGPRRRGGFRLVRELPVQADKIATGVILLKGKDALFCTEVDTGRLRVYPLGSDAAPVVDTTSEYLKATKPESIRYVQHSNDVYILNTEKVVQLGTALAEQSGNPKRQGFFYVNSGALSTKFDVILGKGTASYTISHTTPAEDASTATPEAIATALVAALKAHASVGTSSGYTYTQLGPYVFVQAAADLHIGSSMGTHMVRTSSSSIVKDTAELPAKLPKAADGYVVQVGYDTAAAYYAWDFNESAWKERAAYASRAPVQNLPVYLEAEGSTLKSIDAPGRLAGDSENSPDPVFIGKRLTGLGSFQGRLLYLSGEYLTFSASSQAGVLYRTTMAQVNDDDPIEIASTSTLGVSYEFALPHNGDLLVTSRNVQGIVSGRSVLTPKTAVISIAAQYQMQEGVEPVSTGKSVLYPVQSSVGNSAVWEMTPSEYTEQQVTAHNITEHLPKFIEGKVRSITTSRSSGIAVIFDSSNNFKVHQYLWDGLEKPHTSFHEWSANETAIAVHMQDNVLYVVSQGVAGSVRVLEWDIVNGLGDDWKHTPKLDMYRKFTVADGSISVPKWMYGLEELRSEAIVAYSVTGQNTPYPYRIEDWEEQGEFWVGTSEYISAGDVTLGYKYESYITPSAPVVRDGQGAPILTERAILRSVTALFSKTGTLQVSVSDRARSTPRVQYTPLRMYRNDLDSGEPLAAEGSVTVPMRTDLASTSFTFRTEDIYDMNITAMEYDFRHNQRGRRVHIGGLE